MIDEASVNWHMVVNFKRRDERVPIVGIVTGARCLARLCEIAGHFFTGATGGATSTTDSPASLATATF